MSVLVWGLAPAAVFLVLVGVASVLGVDDGVVRALGVEGVAGIFGALVLVGGGLALRIGHLRACPSCGAWFGEVVSSEPLASIVKEGGHFHGDEGYVTDTRTTTQRAVGLRCRRCAQVWEVTEGATRRTTSRPGRGPERHPR